MPSPLWSSPWLSLLSLLRPHVACPRSKPGLRPLSHKPRPSWGANKPHRAVRLQDGMSDPDAERVLAPMREAVRLQGETIRYLKDIGASDLDIRRAVMELKLKKKALEDRERVLYPSMIIFDRAKMEDLLKRRFFYDQSYAIYGGITGQFDFGPMGCAMKTNLLNAWRSFFVLEEQMLEVDCSVLTPETVLKTSGHVDRFTDLMVKDVGNGECFRVDHLLKAHLEKTIADRKTSESLRRECEELVEKLDGMTKEEFCDLLKKFAVHSPFTGNELTEPVEFNLMFSTQIGPSGLVKGYLRPETAQGIFVNFKRLLEFNQGRLPFAAAQIGNAFRNEISPRSGLLRVREFTMAEIEYFYDPLEKHHPKFNEVRDTRVFLYTACNQMEGRPATMTTMGEAVDKGIVANENLGYFMARIQKFLVLIGACNKRLRFRQHMSNEMAHYACDCWDAELLTSYGWIECVGCADRSAFDLTQHSKATGVRLVAEKKLAQPNIIDIAEVVPIKGAIGKAFKKDAKMLLQKLSSLEKEMVDDLEDDLASKGEYVLNVDGTEYVLSKDMVCVKKYKKHIFVEEFIPSVIEPSFGIGRIMYALFEHNFTMRTGDEQRTFLMLPPIVAPLKCSVLPLSSNPEFQPYVRHLSQDLTRVDVSHKVDNSSGSIGRRYARTDEIAIPFGVTIDFDTLKAPHSATLRERDTMDQVRILLAEIPGVVRDLSSGKIAWHEVAKKYPKFEQQETTRAA